ncbi:MAG: DsbA family protein [Acidobacteria bacterium]|nr:DsbA family protein [Acidobacteriota bacterium]
MKRLLLSIAIASVGAASAARAQIAPPPHAAAAAAAVEVKKEDCGCEADVPADAFAVVNGVRVTRAEIDDPLAAAIGKLQRQVIEARKNELDLQINSRLLDAEARRRGTSTLKLVQDEVTAKAAEPTEADARAFYEQNRARIKAEFPVVQADIVNYLRAERQRAAAKALADRLRAAAQVKVLVAAATPPATAAERARVFATVNGTPVRSSDVEEALRPLIFSVQEQVYALRRRGTELRVNDLLLEAEAKKRGVTTKALLDAEVARRVKAPTEQDAEEFYNQNKERISGDFAQVKEQVLEYLKGQGQTEAFSAFADELRRPARIQMLLTAPQPPVYAITADDQPTRGNQAAAVTVVEFTDYQCPSCAQAQPAVESLMREYGDRVRLVVRDFPLVERHKDAFKAAQAAEAARAQGKYWEYTALLMQHQSALDAAHLKEYAAGLGLDRQKFDAALDSGQYAEQVQRDMQEGDEIGVGGTPTFFVNGRRLAENSYDALKAATEAALQEAAQKQTAAQK